MNLWHTLRREMTGAWRSVRYDLDIHRSAKLAGAFTEEFEPPAESEPRPSRLVPLTGVALLLAGGAAGAFLAISGGLAALGPDSTPPMADPPVAAATAAPDVQPQVSAAETTRPLTPRRPGSRRPAVPSVPPEAVAPPAETSPVIEGSSLPASPSPTASSTSPSPSASPSVSAEGSRSPGPRARR